MIERLKSLFSAKPETAGRAAGDEVTRATAALLFMAAMMDDRVGDEERAEIARGVRERFGLDEEATSALLAEAEETAHDATHFQRFTAEIKGSCDDDSRRQVMELLWRVVCADGEVHDREANLMRRIAGLLYVSDKDSGLARQRALSAIGGD